MTHRATITLDDDAYRFLQTHAGKNRSRFINSLLHKAQQALLAERLHQANKEEAQDMAYQAELNLWDDTLLDGLT
jgi:predicted CopG family antitoxin